MKSFFLPLILLIAGACTVFLSANCALPQNLQLADLPSISPCDYITGILIVYEAVVRTFPTIKNYSVVNLVISALKSVSEFLNNKK